MKKKYVSFPGEGVPFIPLSEAKIGMRLSMLPRPVGRCIPIHDVAVTIPIVPLYCFSYAILAHSYQKSPFWSQRLRLTQAGKITSFSTDVHRVYALYTEFILPHRSYPQCAVLPNAKPRTLNFASCHRIMSRKCGTCHIFELV